MLYRTEVAKVGVKGMHTVWTTEFDLNGEKLQGVPPKKGKPPWSFHLKKEETHYYQP